MPGTDKGQSQVMSSSPVSSATPQKSAVSNSTGYTAQSPNTPVSSASPFRSGTATKRNATSIYNKNTRANESIASSLYKSEPKSDCGNLCLGVVVFIGLLVLCGIIAVILDEHCGYDETTSMQISLGVVSIIGTIFFCKIFFY